MLTDDIINQAMGLIKLQTTHPGLEDTLLGNRNLSQFSIQTGPFCQILNAALHWIVAYALEDAVDDEVFIYD